MTSGNWSSSGDLAASVADQQVPSDWAVPDVMATGEPLMVAPDPAGDLSGWTLGKFADESDISIDDPELISPAARPVLTWREDYPYAERMSRIEYDEVKRALQIELLKLQTWIKETGQKLVLIFEG